MTNNPTKISGEIKEASLENDWNIIKSLFNFLIKKISVVIKNDFLTLLLDQQELKKPTLESEDEMLSMFLFWFGQKVHLKFKAALTIDEVEELAETVKKRLIFDFKNFKEGIPSPITSY